MRQGMSGKVSAATVVVEVASPPSVAADAPPARLGHVDSLRALAALYVVANHVMRTFWLNDTPGGFMGWLTTSVSFGHFAVSVFIVLSGFSLTLPVVRKGYRLPQGVWGFYFRRAWRILPPYYFAMGLSLLLIWLFIGQPTGSHWDSSLPITGEDLLQHILLVHNFALNGGSKINHVFWSIAMECQIYLLFPAFVLLFRRYSPLFVMLAVVTLSLVLLYALVPTWVGRLPGYMSFQFEPQYIGLFAMGMFAASVYVRPTSRWTRLRDRYPLGGAHACVLCRPGSALATLYH